MQWLKNYSKSDVILQFFIVNYSFYKYHGDIEKFDDHSLEWKYSFVAKFFNDLDKFNKLKTQKEKTKEKSTCV